MMKCAYCGRAITGLARKKSRDHVIPRCLYPASKATSKVQRITVSACHRCNSGWSDDEPHFRNVLLLCGEPTLAARELWGSGTRHSLDEVDGHRRTADVARLFVHSEVDGQARQTVYPAKDPRFRRILRKIVRGLCHHHGVLSPVADRRVWVDVLRHVVPPEISDSMEVAHCEPDICRYRYQVIDDEVSHSMWILTFFENKTFVGIVSASPKGFARSKDSLKERD
jgi:hypothetical protein